MTSAAEQKSTRSRSRVTANAAAVLTKSAETAKADAVAAWLVFAAKNGGTEKARDLAREQGRKLREHGKNGTGRRPNTKALDLLNAAYAAGWEANTEREASRGVKPRTSRKQSERGVVARTKKRASNGKRGPGKKLTDEEFLAYVREVRTSYPTANMADELEYAYWVEGLSLSPSKWAKAWVQADPKNASTKVEVAV